MMRNCGNCKYFLNEDASGKGWYDENEMRTICAGKCPKWRGRESRAEWAVVGKVHREIMGKLIFTSCFRDYELPSEMLPELNWNNEEIEVELKITMKDE